MAPRPRKPGDKWKNSTKNQEMEKFNKKAGKMAKQWRRILKYLACKKIYHIYNMLVLRRNIWNPTLGNIKNVKRLIP